MAKTSKDKKVLSAQIVRRQAPLVRRDIEDWHKALQLATRTDNPRFYLLQELYGYIVSDAHLSSQLQLRSSMSLNADYALHSQDGTIDEKATQQLIGSGTVRPLMQACLDSIFYGYTVAELAPDGSVTTVDRRHLDPTAGLLLIQQGDHDGIQYRLLPDYGRSILEFRSAGLGILNQAVPHVLYKRFAQACWSEFCEVCGMPPRYIKTNTQDPELRERYRNMLSQMGTNANCLLDSDDELGFATVNASNGEPYQNLIRLCSDELSLLINGAVLGQDTKNGSNAKEQTSAELSYEVVLADHTMIEEAFNRQVLPALARLGLIPDGRRFAFKPQEDIKQLFDQTMRAAQYFEIDPEWVKAKFGIEVTGPRQMGMLSAPATDNDPKAKNLAYNPAFDPFV